MLVEGKTPALPAYQALSVETLGARLGAVSELQQRLGPDPAQWRAREVGEWIRLHARRVVSEPQPNHRGFAW